MVAHFWQEAERWRQRANMTTNRLIRETSLEIARSFDLMAIVTPAKGCVEEEPVGRAP